MATNKALLVEDDQTLLDVLEYNLVKEGYTVITANNGTRALELVRSDKPEVVILDVMLPELDGFEVCRILRKETTIPIIMLTAKTDEIDKVVGLELGADDYITKPFSMREFLARIRAVLRRSELSKQDSKGSGEASPPVIRFDNFEIDLARYQLSLGGSVLDIRRKEFELLAFLVQNKGQVFSREHLLSKVWGYEYTCDTRTVDVHIRWLRQKIEGDPAHPQHHLTVRGIGYMFEE